MISDDRLMAMINRLLAQSRYPLSPLGAGILSACHFELSSDSRSFARQMEIAHALVIRECISLSHDHDLIRLDDKRERSQRLFYSLTQNGMELFVGAVNYDTTFS